MSQTPHATDAESRIASAYAPNLFRRCGQVLIDRLAKHLHDVGDSKLNVLNWNSPQENLEAAKALLNESANPSASDPKEDPTARVLQLADTILQRQHNLHDPRYIGHQVPPPIPAAALFEAISALTNQGMAVYEMGPWATAVEAAIVEELGEAVGFEPGQFAGVVTSGGSLANLTALLSARNRALPKGWQYGLSQPSMPLPVLVTHDEVHYSVVRAAGVLGIGADHVLRCRVDRQRRMDPADLDQTLAQLRLQSTPIIAVVAAACSTRTGAFDPLEDIADVCAKHKVWLHVDAAHGGAACMSTRHQHLVAGLHQADSVVLDAHKMLFAPALCTFLFYRDPSNRFAAFQQDASYLFGDDVPPEFESGLATIECTKRAAVYGLWGTWMLFGKQLFSDLVDTTFDRTQQFHQMLVDADEFEPLHEPQCNIQVFRYLPESIRAASPETIGAFQLELRKRLVRSGQFYIVTCKDEGIPALRTTVINPLTTCDTLQSLLDAIRETGRSII